MTSWAILSLLILILLSISCIKTHMSNLLPKFNYTSLISNHGIPSLTHFKLVWNLFFQLCNFWQQYDDVPKHGQELGMGRGTRRYESRGAEEAAECAVCLCKIEEGEEIRELRCEHLFHRVCLDRWVGYKNMNCPLCRGSLCPRTRAGELGEERLVFQFCAIRRRNRESLWLR